MMANFCNKILLYPKSSRMLKQTSKKDDNIQSKSNLMDLFRKRIETRTGKNTPSYQSIKPSSIVIPPNYKHKVTPSKASILALDDANDMFLSS